MIASWLFIEFSLHIDDELSVAVARGALSVGSSEKTLYHADEGREAHELIVIHAQQFDPDELIRLAKVAFEANRKLIVLFHQHHFQLLSEMLYEETGWLLEPLDSDKIPNGKLIKKLSNDIISSASKDIHPDYIEIGTMYSLVDSFSLVDKPQPIIVGPTKDDQDQDSVDDKTGEAMKELEDSILRKLDNISRTPNTEMDNEILLPRDVLLYGWILQRQWGKIPWNDLLSLVGESLMGNIRQFIREHNRYFVTPPRVNMDNLVFSNEMMDAIQIVYGDPKHFNIMGQVPFFPDGVSGDRLVKYFVGLERPPMPLSEMMCGAFEAGLNNIRVTTINRENNIFRVSNGDQWSFVFGVISTNHAALNDRDFYKYAAFLIGYCKDSEQALLFAPNSENIGISKDAIEFPKLHHVWSISIVRFFNGLGRVINQKAENKKTVTKSFPVIFPPVGESFSASDACRQLEDVCNQG